MLYNVLLTLLGLTLLSLSANYLVNGSVGLARILNISKAVIGITIVAMGSSMPELMVSIKAAFSGSPDLAYGNVLGSNIMNIAVVLGVSALIKPIPAAPNSLKIDWPILFVATVVLLFFSMNLVLQRYEGIILISALAAFIIFQIREAKRHPESLLELDEIEEELKNKSFDGKKGIVIYLVFIIFGISGLNYGSEWFVQGSVAIAKTFGVSERVIGLTIVAIGTSAPEFFTSVVAAAKNESEIAINNIIGSNIFNILCVLGITSTITPITIDSGFIHFDNYVCLGFVGLLLLTLLGDKKISRTDGLFLLLGYGIYMYFVF